MWPTIRCTEPMVYATNSTPVKLTKMENTDCMPGAGSPGLMVPTQAPNPQYSAAR